MSNYGKKPEYLAACCVDEWQTWVWGCRHILAFSLEDAPQLAAEFIT
jgi:hypothetical protein